MSRITLVILLLVALFSSSCSVFIARSGLDLESLTTRNQVHQTFGMPSEAEAGNSEPSDEYRTHKKLSEFYRSAGNGMGFAMTVGLSEFIAFPRELYLLGRNSFVGQDLRFEYDEFGNVDRVLLNGESPLPQKPARPKAEGTSMGPVDAAAEK